MRCPSCHTTQPDAAKTCKNCGSSLTDITVGYVSQAALDADSAVLQAEGWHVTSIDTSGKHATVAARYGRTIAGGQRKLAWWQIAGLSLVGLVVLGSGSV